MPPHKPTKPLKTRPGLDLNQQAANALLAATFDFLWRNKIPKKSILSFTRQHLVSNQRDRSLRLYRELEQAQEDMGLIMSTWFSHPEFLDASGRPLPLTTGKSVNSVAHLIRVSRAQIKKSIVIKFMRQSPSIKFTSDGHLIALRRFFALPKLEVARAAFVVERYLETVVQASVSRNKNAPLLMERSCHVSKLDLARIVPLLRDLESRGTAFLDSIDGDLEGRRLRRSNRKRAGEVGIHVFVWLKPSNGSQTPAAGRVLARNSPHQSP